MFRLVNAVWHRSRFYPRVGAPALAVTMVRESQVEKERASRMDSEIYPAEQNGAAGHQNHGRRGTRTPATWGPVDPVPRGDPKVQAHAQGRDNRRGLERMWDVMYGRTRRRVETNDSDQPSSASAEPRDEGAPGDGKASEEQDRAAREQQ